MPKWLPKSCKRCKAKAGPGVVISRRALCRPCAQEAVVRSIQVTKAMHAAGAYEPSSAAEGFAIALPPPGGGGTPTAKRKPPTAAKKAKQTGPK